MSVSYEVASFAAVVALLTIVPGLDTTLVVRSAVVQGRRRGSATACGVVTGVLIWGAAAAGGISALLLASRIAYNIVRLAGAVYLLWLGVTLLRRSFTKRRDDHSEAGHGTSRHVEGSVLRSWWRGLASNLLNPKVGTFYIAILPQFIPAHSPHLLLGLTLTGVNAAEDVIWFTLLIIAAHLARRFLDNQRAHKIMERVSGTVLIGFGVRLALSSRPG
jgi:threonine/homoserine/homoserine lactone efflux protein